jgi:hypothetical protein
LGSPVLGRRRTLSVTDDVDYFRTSDGPEVLLVKESEP